MTLMNIVWHKGITRWQTISLTYSPLESYFELRVTTWLDSWENVFGITGLLWAQDLFRFVSSGQRTSLVSISDLCFHSCFSANYIYKRFPAIFWSPNFVFQRNNYSSSWEANMTRDSFRGMACSVPSLPSLPSFKVGVWLTGEIDCA